jgi:NAD(P)-dependent dehydrogenase (short-subunit alcohol dehydrogenase family)
MELHGKTAIVTGGNSGIGKAVALGIDADVSKVWPMPGSTAYCLSKGGMRMLTRIAAVELGSHGSPGL